MPDFNRPCAWRWLLLCLASVSCMVGDPDPDSVAGSGLEFEERGEFQLKGLGEQRRVYRALRR